MTATTTKLNDIINHEHHDGARAATTPYRRYDTESRWPLIGVDGQWFVDLSGGVSIRPRTTTVPAIDVTDSIGDISHNNSVEAFVAVGSEGDFVSVRMADGKKSQRRIAYLTVIVSLKTSTADELYDEEV